MGVIAVVARFALAAVFSTAALAKILDRSRSREALTSLGIPSALARPVAVVLPFAELGIAVALVPNASAPWAAAGALGLLVAFVVTVGLNLARGNRPDCRCFGQLHPAPIGRRTLARNGVLAALAGVVLWQGRAGTGGELPSVQNLTLLGWIGLVTALVLSILVAVEGWVILNLWRQHGRLLGRVDALEAASGQRSSAPAVQDRHAGLPLGSPAPAFRLSGAFGETMTLDALRAAGLPVMLVFTEPGCGPCTALLPDVGSWQREHASALTVAVVSRGDALANRGKAARAGVRHVLIQETDEVADAYGAGGTPSAVVVDAAANIASEVAIGGDAIRALVARTVGRPTPIPVAASNGNGHRHRQQPEAPAVGQPAPSLALPDLSGHTVDLAQFRGRATVVLFWNPGCGFCSQMLPDLKSWEERPPDGAPQLVVVSTGSVEENRAMGLRSPVLLDPGGEAMRVFGANGTPMGVRVDGEGIIASDVVAGASALRALLDKASLGAGR